jgi:glycine hydroxymethyltransferase
MLLTNEADIARRVLAVTFPGLLQTRDQNKLSALAHALTETAEFGTTVARQMVVNAQALAAALEDEGFRVLARDRGYTRTHQVFLELGDSAQTFEKRCQAANILVSDCALVGGMALKQRTGARLATHELTRLGMTEADMVEVARLIRRAARDAEDPSVLALEVARLLARFPRITYSFD